VGLGWLGVVTEVTLQCVPAHRLLQHTFVETREGVRRRHAQLLKHQHMRYMWIPHSDTVVVVTCDPIADDMPRPPAPVTSEFEAVAPLRNLLLRKGGRAIDAKAAGEMNFAQLRDALIALSPLDKSHIIEVNRAEADYWRRAQGFRVDWSDKLLGFECGGQQWVSEVAMPCGTIASPNGNDLAYMEQLLESVEATDLATPAPIEQRWTRSSRACMSPAHSERPDDLFTWVGIIMYLPTQEKEQRDAITQRFWDYNAHCRRKLWSKFGAHQHWAKIEIPESPDELRWVRARLAERFPVAELNAAKRKLDPKGILGNHLIDTLLMPNEWTLEID